MHGSTLAAARLEPQATAGTLEFWVSAAAGAIWCPLQPQTVDTSGQTARHLSGQALTRQAEDRLRTAVSAKAAERAHACHPPSASAAGAARCLRRRTCCGRKRTRSITRPETVDSEAEQSLLEEAFGSQGDATSN